MAELPTVFQALNLVMRDVTKVEKRERNQQQNFSFRGIDATTKAVAPALREHGVVIVPSLMEYSYQTVEIGKNRTPMAHVVVKVAHRYYGPAGDWVEAIVGAESMDSGDKAFAKAMSVAFRISLLQTFSLPTDEPDADSFSYERSEAQERHPANVRQLPERPKPPVGTIGRPAENSQIDQLANLQILVKNAKEAKTLDSLRTVWTEVGNMGLLNEKLAQVGISPDMTFMELLYERSSELDPKRGDEKGDNGTAGNGAVAPKAANRVGRAK